MAARQDRHTFAFLERGHSRYDSGSRVDVDSRLLMAGLSGALALSSGTLTLGGFITHGTGDYDTRNSFANTARVKGSGDSQYTGFGLLARLDLTGADTGHPYLEASLQGGRVKTEFRSGDLIDAFGRGAKYDSASNYYGGHLAAGYLWQTRQGELDLYGQWLYTRREGDTVTLNTGDPIRFAAVESQRLRLGGRYAWTVNETIKPYLGLAWEREFGGKARATTYGYEIDAPKLKGDTGIVELGLSTHPSPARPLRIELGVQGYAGKREGVSAMLKVEYRF
jgi:outer membrane autotransporter protein